MAAPQGAFFFMVFDNLMQLNAKIPYSEFDPLTQPLSGKNCNDTIFLR